PPLPGGNSDWPPLLTHIQSGTAAARAAWYRRAAGAPRLAHEADRRSFAVLRQRGRRPGTRDRGILLGDRRADPQRLGFDRDLVGCLLQHALRAPLSHRGQTLSGCRTEDRGRW